MTVADAHITLCVDLDGTLIRTDLLHEGLLKAAKSAPHKLPSLFAALKGGKASFKHALAELIRIDPTLLVYRPEVMALINEARDKGRSVVLCTASPALFGKAVADHLGLFEAVMTSTSDINLAARHKAAALVNKFGEGNFDYIGNSKHDAPIFASCRRGYLVSSNGRLRRVCSANQRDMLFINDPATNALTWMKAMRVHQWVKNLLIFLPLLAGHQVGDMNRLVQAVLAFAAFSLCASAIYIANDLLDLDADRAHKSKRKRPFAAGMIPASSGVAAIAILLFASFLLATLLPWRFGIVLLGYVIVTTAYSFALKR
ncbi:MAG TPA: UbiA family prenyltransferase, partial [Sphingobium sp.]|nr:UbiA family prenyltransferase [Sphingobium sp.]